MISRYVISAIFGVAMLGVGIGFASPGNQGNAEATCCQSGATCCIEGVPCCTEKDSCETDAACCVEKAPCCD
jgi:hypothetical protein